MKIQGLHKVYFLGIGGIGMSAIALYFLNNGCEVEGYDKVSTALTKTLEKAGAKIHYSEDPKLVSSDIDMVVYTPAIPLQHSEWTAIKALNVPIYKRAEVLGECTKGYKTLAVAGSHGKTTTSALLSYLLYETRGCCAFLGGVANNYNTNFLYSKDAEWVVAEADEYDRSFLQLHPLYSVVTAMDPDHLDIYGTADNMRKAFCDFMKQTDAEHGGIVLKQNLLSYTEGIKIYRTYDTNEGLKPQVYAQDIKIENGAYKFDYVSPNIVIENLVMTYPGRHNVENALAAITVALAAGVKEEEIKTLLPLFKGVKRRFDIRLREEDFMYVDDYAHHPREIEACLSSLKELYPERKLRVVFQPHLYSRTADLAAEFAKSLSLADEIILIDIYPAREEAIPGVSSKSIGSLIRGKVVEYTSLSNAVKTLSQMDKPGLLVSMGAGNIDTLVEPIQALYKK